MITIRVVPPQGPSFDKRFTVDSIVVGRSSQVELPVPDRAMSRRHARLFRDGVAWKVEDLGSRNGTFVDGRALDQAEVLLPGSRVEVGGSSLELVAAAAPVAPTFGAGQTVFRPAVELLRETGVEAEVNDEAAGGSHQRVVERLRILNDVHRALASSISSDELLDLILERTFEHLQPEEGAIFLREGTGPLRCAASRSLTRGSGQAGLGSSHLADEVVGKGQAALVLDAQVDGRFNQAASLLGAGIRSLVAAPLLEPEGASGMIVLGSRLAVREFTEEDMNLLTSLASVAAMRLRNVRLAREAAERQHLEQEVALARQIQVALLPARLPALPGYELWADNLPSRGVSGDFYKLSTRSGGQDGVIMVADVSGKGIAASLLTASLEALTAPLIESGLAPAEICARASRLLYERTPAAKYATCFFAVLDLARHRLTYVNAGHNPALVVPGDGGPAAWLSSNGPPIGILPAATYAEGTVDLAVGDTVVMYTDGFTEAEDPDEEEYGTERLRAVVEASRRASLAELAAAVAVDLDAHVRGVPFADDRTLVLLRRVGAA